MPALAAYQLKRQAFFGSFFQRLEKMNNTNQNLNLQGKGNKNREITIYTLQKNISL